MYTIFMGMFLIGELIERKKNNMLNAESNVGSLLHGLYADDESMHEHARTVFYEDIMNLVKYNRTLRLVHCGRCLPGAKV